MKYILGFTGTFLIICLLITAAVNTNTPNAQAQEQSQIEQRAVYDVTSEVSETSTETEYEYILSESDGMIAAFQNGKTTPIYISTVRISDLPETDRDTLSKGIGAENRHQLNKLIEEYCS